MTIVVNLYAKAYDIYIGRYNPIKRLSASKWKNPYKLAQYSDRVECLKDYCRYLAKRNDLLLAIHNGDLKDRALGCYCSPKLCHGTILAYLSNSGLSVEQMKDTLQALATGRESIDRTCLV